MMQDLAPSRDRVDDAAEMNHRIANNLSLLASLVRLDGLAILDPEARTVLETTRRRIHAIASLHRRLYRHGCADGVDLGGFLLELGEDLRALCEDAGRRRRLLVETVSVIVGEEDAAAISILVAELVGNACKYAYLDHEPGEIRVLQAASSSGAWSLIVEDDGRGFDRQDSLPARPGLGSTLIASTMDRLGASHAWENADPGTRFVMWVPGPSLPHTSIGRPRPHSSDDFLAISGITPDG